MGCCHVGLTWSERGRRGLLLPTENSKKTGENLPSPVEKRRGCVGAAGWKKELLWGLFYAQNGEELCHGEEGLVLAGEGRKNTTELARNQGLFCSKGGVGRVRKSIVEGATLLQTREEEPRKLLVGRPGLEELSSSSKSLENTAVGCSAVSRGAKGNGCWFDHFEWMKWSPWLLYMSRKRG